MGNKHVISDLYQMQSLSLNAKVRMTQRRIREWVDEYGEDGVYISFSGGKDSTVLLNIARKLYPNIRAVFVDTGLEYPEIRAFVKGFDNVDWIRPKLTFREVIGKYGYLEKSPGRFEKMKLTHPKQYEYIMKPWNEGGLGFKQIIDWINEHGNLNIRY